MQSGCTCNGQRVCSLLSSLLFLLSLFLCFVLSVLFHVFCFILFRFVFSVFCCFKFAVLVSTLVCVHTLFVILSFLFLQPPKHFFTGLGILLLYHRSHCTLSPTALPLNQIFTTFLGTFFLRQTAIFGFWEDDSTKEHTQNRNLSAKLHESWGNKNFFCHERVMKEASKVFFLASNNVEN